MKNTVVIIGAGINGLMCAYHLVKQDEVNVIVYDKNQIPNPTSASFGKHRLIHPWSNHGSTDLAKRALSALYLWRDILNDIGSDSFEQTGVFALSNNDFNYQSIKNIDAKLLSVRNISSLMPLLEDVNFDYVHYFPQFGVLLADKILIELVKYLRNNGVKMYGGNSIALIDAQKGEISLSDGKTVAGDKIIVSAGYGADTIIKSSFKDYKHILPSFKPMRCYVAYVSHTKTKVDKKISAWASLGVSDMWGMPPLRGIPMKIGYGDFTKPCDPKETDESNTIAQCIIDKYIQTFPQFDGLEIEGTGVNHWAKIDCNSDYTKIDRTVIITSDNGLGFKFAPYISLKVVNSLTEMT